LPRREIKSGENCSRNHGTSIKSNVIETERAIVWLGAYCPANQYCANCKKVLRARCPNDLDHPFHDAPPCSPMIEIRRSHNLIQREADKPYRNYLVPIKENKTICFL
jgi:hypothetical protein